MAGNCLFSRLLIEIYIHSKAPSTDTRSGPPNGHSACTGACTFVSLFVDRESGALEFDWNDELVTGTGLTRGGSVVHPSIQPAD